MEDTGKFTTKFSGFAGTGTIDKDEFQGQLNKLSLYMLGLFLGRFVLSYINKVAFPTHPVSSSPPLTVARSHFA